MLTHALVHTTTVLFALIKCPIPTHDSLLSHCKYRLKPENEGVYALRVVGTNWGHTQPVARGDCISSIRMGINTQPAMT